MLNKKNWLVIPVMVLVFGMAVVGCASGPKTFVKGSSGDTLYCLGMVWNMTGLFVRLPLF